ncbi:MAG: hypothetical protein K2W96_24675, partial [Gemmataceae bacterium]|nr:hypothetical protein [Gemmataceae bacterium]
SLDVCQSVLASFFVRVASGQYDLDSLYPNDLEGAAGKLHAFAVREPLPELLFALAEVSWMRAERLHRDPPRACSCYYLAAGYAWHYLFRDGQREGERFDPRFRIACDLYNASVARLVAAAQAVGRLDPRSCLELPGPPGYEGIKLRVAHHGFDYKPEEFGPLLPCSEFRVTGLANHHRTYGLGVPLIGSRDGGARMPAHGCHPLRANFPVTAFFRFDGTLDDLARQRAGCLELVNPLAKSAVAVAERRVPLESDLTTPLAYFLSNARLENAGLAGFLKPDSLRGAAGLHLLQPYRPGKIPVVLVHGLLSSPLTWAPMFNDLQADPVLRDRFQFWVYFYPTGNPYLASAAQLRSDLARTRRALDPHGADPALSEMVFVGHSMGGLMARLMTVDGGDDFWGSVSGSPLDRLRLRDETRSELRNTFYFERQPFVTRAIFLGTPHRGSKLSPSFLGRLGARLAGVPQRAMEAFKDIVEDNPEAWRVGKQLPTSVDLLAPDSPALRLIADRPRPAGVHYHSVVGVSPRGTLLVERLLGGGYKRPSDGVVPYDSAHLDAAESELVVPADHFTVHQHALAILEVRRILLEHVRDHDERHRTIVPVGRR